MEDKLEVIGFDMADERGAWSTRSSPGGRTT